MSTVCAFLLAFHLLSLYSSTPKSSRHKAVCIENTTFFDVLGDRFFFPRPQDSLSHNGSISRRGGSTRVSGTSASSRSRPKKMECWGADKPFANITENNLTAKSIAITVRSIDNFEHGGKALCQLRARDFLSGNIFFHSKPQMLTLSIK